MHPMLVRAGYLYGPLGREQGPHAIVPRGGSAEAGALHYETK